VDPKRLLESTQDAPSPNVLVQNLLGVARSEAAPDGARRRARRAIDSVFTPPRGSEKAAAREATATEATAADGAPLKNVARSANKVSPPKSLPVTERRPAGTSDPCSGCTPFG
jgi:hypothetical protein